MPDAEPRVHVTGLALLPGPDTFGESVDLAGVTLPDGPIPLTADFDHTRVIGQVTLRRTLDGTRLVADAQVAARALADGSLRFAIGGVVGARQGAVVTQLCDVRVALTEANTDPRIGPVTREPA